MNFTLSVLPRGALLVSRKENHLDDMMHLGAPAMTVVTNFLIHQLNNKLFGDHFLECAFHITFTLANALQQCQILPKLQIFNCSDALQGTKGSYHVSHYELNRNHLPYLPRHISGSFI